MKGKIAEVRAKLMELQGEMDVAKKELETSGGTLTSAQLSKFQTAQRQLNDAELNLMKLWRTL